MADHLLESTQQIYQVFDTYIKLSTATSPVYNNYIHRKCCNSTKCTECYVYSV